jgi:hypothetical protein
VFSGALELLGILCIWIRGWFWLTPVAAQSVFSGLARGGRDEKTSLRGLNSFVLACSCIKGKKCCQETIQTRTLGM